MAPLQKLLDQCAEYNPDSPFMRAPNPLFPLREGYEIGPDIGEHAWSHRNQRQVANRQREEVLCENSSSTIVAILPPTVTHNTCFQCILRGAAFKSDLCEKATFFSNLNMEVIEVWNEFEVEFIRPVFAQVEFHTFARQRNKTWTFSVWGDHQIIRGRIDRIEQMAREKSLFDARVSKACSDAKVVLSQLPEELQGAAMDRSLERIAEPFRALCERVTTFGRSSRRLLRYFANGKKKVSSNGDDKRKEEEIAELPVHFEHQFTMGEAKYAQTPAEALFVCVRDTLGNNACKPVELGGILDSLPEDVKRAFNDTVAPLYVQKKYGKFNKSSMCCRRPHCMMAMGIGFGTCQIEDVPVETSQPDKLGDAVYTDFFPAFRVVQQPSRDTNSLLNTEVLLNSLMARRPGFSKVEAHDEVHSFSSDSIDFLSLSMNAFWRSEFYFTRVSQVAGTLVDFMTHPTYNFSEFHGRMSMLAAAAAVGFFDEYIAPLHEEPVLETFNGLCRKFIAEKGNSTVDAITIFRLVTSTPPPAFSTTVSEMRPLVANESIAKDLKQSDQFYITAAPFQSFEELRNSVRRNDLGVTSDHVYERVTDRRHTDAKGEFVARWTEPREDFAPFCVSRINQANSYLIALGTTLVSSGPSTSTHSVFNASRASKERRAFGVTTTPSPQNARPLAKRKSKFVSKMGTSEHNIKKLNDAFGTIVAGNGDLLRHLLDNKERAEMDFWSCFSEVYSCDGSPNHIKKRRQQSSEMLGCLLGDINTLVSNKHASVDGFHRLPVCVEFLVMVSKRFKQSDCARFAAADYIEKNSLGFCFLEGKAPTANAPTEMELSHWSDDGSDDARDPLESLSFGMRAYLRGGGAS